MTASDETLNAAKRLLAGRGIVLVGLMGAGKSSIGRRLAARLGVPFVDTDNEIEASAGCSISEIFARHGEAAFRDGERRVIARLLNMPAQVMATGGGAFMDPVTREAIRRHGVSVWLRAELDVLVRRCARRGGRPLLDQGDPSAVLAKLMEERYPVYAQADIVVDSSDGPHDAVVESILARLAALKPAAALNP
jgi:shikimate kinase